MSTLPLKTAEPPVPLLDGFAALAPNYDGLILDLWGVLHDGVAAFPWAVDCLGRLRAAGVKVLILSNAPRRIGEIVARNRELGIAPDLADHVMSSGQEAWEHLRDRPDAWYRALGVRCYHLGPERDYGMREDLDLDFVGDLGQADFLLNTGALGFADTAETYRDLLAAARARELPMVCANPDLVVVRGGAMEICAGTIAAAYEEIGGDVRYHGKPHPSIYETCLARLGVSDKARIAAVGDSLRTDIAGARRAGIGSVFVAGGIHAEELGMAGEGAAPDPARLQAIFRDPGPAPDAALPRFAW